jgi:peptide/nickel transport system substrate-binding protein
MVAKLVGRSLARAVRCRPARRQGRPHPRARGGAAIPTVASALAALLAVLLGGGLSAPAAGAAWRAPASRHAATKPTGNVASYALPVGETFSWILPLENQANYEDWDSNVEGGMWVPLYFAGEGSKTGIDYTLSVGKKPVYSDGDTTITVTMNPTFTWADGQKVTSTDVKFFFELVDAGKKTLGNYVPGELPDDITSVTYPGPDTFVLHLNHAYNPTWFTGNQLTWIYPLPAQTWDRTCATCPAGSAAATPSGAKKVFAFLFSQSKDLHTYASNSLWKTVDGPWMITGFNGATYQATFAANPHYTGPTKPKLAGYKVYSFTTETAELDAVRSGTLTFGYIPSSDLKEESTFKHDGFVVKPWKLFYNQDMELGYTSKTWGPLVKQLYVRQALQHLVTEHLYITRTLHGDGLVDYGPVADYPGSPYVSPTLRKDPYPYNLSAAEHLLEAHGWKVTPGGTDVCQHAGAGPADCGPGIKKGKALSLSFMYATGTTSFLAEVSAFQTAAKKVGIDVALNGQTENTMFSIAGVCPATPPCKYGIAGYAGFMWDYGQYQLLPSGDNQFGKGNFWAGGYTTPKAQQLIAAADDSPGLQPLYAAENYLSKNVASLWWPLGSTVVVVKKALKGWQQLNPYFNPNPMTWYFSS